MDKKHPNPDMSARGTQAHVTSTTDFTGIAPAMAKNDNLTEISDAITKGQRQSYPFLAAQQNEEMKKRLRRDQI